MFFNISTGFCYTVVHQRIIAFRQMTHPWLLFAGSPLTSTVNYVAPGIIIRFSSVRRSVVWLCYFCVHEVQVHSSFILCTLVQVKVGRRKPNSALIVEGEANQFRGSFDSFMGLIHFCENHISGISRQKFIKSILVLTCSLLRIKEFIEFYLYKTKTKK